MKEVNLIIKLFKDLFEGNSWIDVNIMNTIKGLSSEEAATKVYNEFHTVWEIVNHMISWRLAVLERMQGKLSDEPPDNYFSEVADKSDTAWNETLIRLRETQLKWIKFLETFSEDQFTIEYPTNHMTYYEHIHGILQHDAYHLGQLTSLVKTIKLRKS